MMEKYMNVQIIYRDSNSEKYYLSPYTDIYQTEDLKIFMKRRDTQKNVLLSVSTDAAINAIITELESGIEYSQLVSMLDYKIIDMMLSNGVIE